MTEMTGGVWRRRGDRLAVTVHMIPEARDCRWIGSDGLRRHDDGRIHPDRDSPQDLVEWQCGPPEPQPLPLITKPGVYRRIDDVLVKIRRHDDLDLWVGDDGYHRNDDGRLPEGRRFATAIGTGDLVEYIGPLPDEPAAEVQATANPSDTETRHEAEPSPGGIMAEGVEGNSYAGNFTPEYTESIESLRDDRDRLKSALAESSAAFELQGTELVRMRVQLQEAIQQRDQMQKEWSTAQRYVSDCNEVNNRLTTQVSTLQCAVDELQKQLAAARQELLDRDANDQVPGTNWKAEAEAQNAMNELLRRDMNNLRDIQIKTSQKVSDMTEQNQGLQQRNQDLVLQITRLKEEHAKQIATWQASSEAMSGQIVALQADNIMLRAKPGGTVGDQQDVAELEVEVETLNAKVEALKLENIGLKQNVSSLAEKNRQLSDELDAKKVQVGNLRNKISELEAVEHNLIEEAKKIVEQLEQAKTQLESQKLNSQTANSVVSMWQQRAQQFEKDLKAELQNHRATEIRLDEVRRLLLFLVQNVHCHNNDPTEDAQ